MQKTYITTAIPYVNGAPHIGHVEDYLIADIFARYCRLQDRDVRFQAGTDEHGSKIEQKAKALDLDIQEYVDNNSAKFRDFISDMNISNTDFIRTTDPAHVKNVQEIWQKLAPADGDYTYSPDKNIYKDSYDGWYCTGCECFITDNEYKENNGICPDHQTSYERLEESNYYLNIAKFKDQIRAAIESDEMRILPEFRKKEVLKLLVDSPNVSISRPREHLNWGVSVPGDSSQVMYVWMDALTNYISVLGYPANDISDYWPATLQVVGKDILRFHAIIWPAILLGLGLPLPHTILSHGFILADGQKMSKSIGNVVDPIEVLQKHGIDAFRYYFTRHIDTFSDSDFTWDKFESAYADELANDYGNLVQRLSAMSKKNKVKGVDFTPVYDGEYESIMDSLHFSAGIDYVWSLIQNINKHIEETKPWMVAKEDPAAAVELLKQLNTELLQANYLLSPFLPDATAKVQSIFTADKIVPPETPLFPKA